MKRYNTLSDYLRNTYGEKVMKICVDGGFTCPNRDGRAGYGGCIFCGERGAGEHISGSQSISGQVKSYFKARENKLKSNKFIVYFQNFTNTYESVHILKERYDAALIDNRIIILSVGTRPDCLDNDVAELLASYKDRYDVWVELGLQTADDHTAALINRGYHSERFTKAVEILNRYGIDVIAHIIIGLPSETLDHIKRTVDFLNTHRLKGIKIHSLYVMKGTKLADMYNKGLFKPITEKEYVDWTVYAITHLSPGLIIHRLTGDCPPGLLLAPEWNADKSRIIQSISKALDENNWYQGIFWRESV